MNEISDAQPVVRASRRPATVFAVTSGKGGVGKTNVTINVAVALARLGYRVGVLDADFGLGNIDVLLGLTPDGHVGQVVSGEKRLADIVVEGPSGVRIIPASSGLQSLTALNPVQRGRLHAALDEVRCELDYLLIDTAAGISDNVLHMLQFADRVIVVTSLEPSAIVDAYAVTKVLSRMDSAKEIGIVVNRVRTPDEARLAFQQIETAARRFLGHAVAYYGFVSADPALRAAVIEQRAIVDLLPQSPASRCYRIMASRLAGLGPAGLEPRGPMPTLVSLAEAPLCA